MSGRDKPKTLTESRVIQLINTYLKRAFRQAFGSNLANSLAVDAPIVINNPGPSASLGLDIDTHLTVVAGELSIADQGVDTAQLANLAVTTAKLAANAVTTVKITDANVTTAKIADLNVTTAKIADLNVTTAKIADLNVTTGKLADNAVTTVKITDANVTTAKIADLNVTTGKLADNAVTTVKITDANVTTAKIADLNVTTGKLADNAVTTVKITDLNVTTGKIAALAVTTAKIADDAVDKDKLGIVTTKGDLLSFSTEPSRVAVGANGKVLIADSTATSGLAYAGPYWDQFITKASTTSITNSNTTTADPELVITVAAGEIWFFELYLIYSGDDATADFRWQWGVSAGTMTGFVQYYAQHTSADAININTGNQENAVANASIRTYGTDAADTKRMAIITAFMSFTNAGTFNFKWAQGTTTAAKTAKVWAGSFIRGKKVI